MMFTSWYGRLRVVLAGVLAYVALVALVRVSGKRTLSKMKSKRYLQVGLTCARAASCYRHLTALAAL